MLDYDIIVVGGGPSGLMSCVAAGERGASVLLIDKGDKLGRKLGISGGGRCNVTNAKEQDELIANIPGNGRFYIALFSIGTIGISWPSSRNSASGSKKRTMGACSL